MGSQHPPLAPCTCWSCWVSTPSGASAGYLGSGYKREDASIRSLGLTQACMSPLSGVLQRVGATRITVLSPSPSSALEFCPDPPQGPHLSFSLALFGELGTLLSPFQVESSSDQALSLELQLFSSGFGAGFPLQLPTLTLSYECPAFAQVPPGTGNSPSPGQFW